MNEDMLFRIIVLIFVLLGFGTRIYFHRTAGTLQDSLQEQKEGGVLIIAGLLMVGWFIAMALFLFYPQWLTWSDLEWPSWLRWIGVALSLVGAPFFFWIHQVLGKNFSGTVYIQEDHSIVQEGPYRWIRHPMYTAYLLGHLSYLLMTANWFIGLTGILTITIVMIVRVPNEEAAMLEKFGDDYRLYMQRTSRFLPRLG